VYTDYRPTPLQHYMFPAGGDGLHMIVDERGVFREDSFQKAVAALTAKDGAQHGEGTCRLPAMGSVKGDDLWGYHKGSDNGQVGIWVGSYPARRLHVTRQGRACLAVPFPPQPSHPPYHRRKCLQQAAARRARRRAARSSRRTRTRTSTRSSRCSWSSSTTR